MNVTMCDGCTTPIDHNNKHILKVQVWRPYVSYQAQHFDFHDYKCLAIWAENNK